MSVLGLQTSHLLLILTNLGFGTVLTAACAREGCSDILLLLFIIIITGSNGIRGVGVESSDLPL
jgi:hypothetical protein